MSYILDALKKSEAEREQARLVSLLERPTGSASISARTFGIVAVVLVINAVLLATWMYWPRENSVTPLREQAQSIHKTAESGSQSPASPPESLSNPRQLQPAATIPTPTPEAVSFDELSELEQNNLPPLEISTHIYASDSDLRAIVVNGKRFQEGENISTTLRLIEITEGGMIVEFKGRRIEIPVLEDW